MNILQVSAELFPLLKTGGLADVAGALPGALQAEGCDVRVLLPGFTPILEGLDKVKHLTELVTPWGEKVHLLAGELSALGVKAYVIEAPALCARPGNPYEDTHRHPYGDNHRRFALLGWVASLLAQGLDSLWQPQVVHSHDWHAGLASAYLAFAPPREGPRVRTVFTVHNLAYQGLFSGHHLAELGLPPAAMSIHGLEYHGQISFMKAGLFYSDRITTVSPTYAQEIQTPEQGCGLDGLLRGRRHVLSGILNGVDESIWNPATDKLIQSRYEAGKMAGKAQCRAALQNAFGLEAQSTRPVFGVVSRLTEQKGLHLVLAALDAMVAQGGQLVMLGSGEAWMENAFRAYAENHPESVAVHLGYDESLAHRIFAASDVTLVPSRFEPCGLTQMYGFKYGSLPLAHRVGGLADTVVDCSLEDMAAQQANGFIFDDFSQAGFERAMRRAFALYARRKDWADVVNHAMRLSMGWQRSARAYVALYQQVTH